MPPPEIHAVWFATVPVAILTASVFINRKKGRRGRWWRFSLLSLCFGPVLCILIAFIAWKAGAVHPEDVGRMLRAFTTLGFVAGVIGAIAFGAATLLSGGGRELDGVL